MAAPFALTVPVAILPDDGVEWHDKTPGLATGAGTIDNRDAMTGTDCETPVEAGVAERTITPPVGIPLLGVVGTPSTGVREDLFARALVLGDDRQSVAIVALDLIGLDFAFSDDIASAVREQTGIGTTLLCCSHTHSAPYTMPWSVLGWEGLIADWGPWRDGLRVKIIAAVAEAGNRRRPVSLRAGRAPVQIGCNRRMMTPDGMRLAANPDGAVVPWVDVLSLHDNDGGTIAILFAHAAHAVAVHGASTLIGPDYPGFAVAEVRRQFGGDTAAMFLQGCCGNVNVGKVDGGWEFAEQVGAARGRAAATAAMESEPIPSAGFHVTSRRVALPLADPPAPSECEAALPRIREQLAAAQDPRTVWSLRDYVRALEDLLAKSRRGERQTLRFDAHCVGIGDRWGLLAVPHEVFAEYQLWADAASPYRRTMMAAYVNACESYVPTDAELALGGYEAASPPRMGAALRYKYRAALDPGGERLIKEAILGLFREVGDDPSAPRQCNP